MKHNWFNNNYNYFHEIKTNLESPFLVDYLIHLKSDFYLTITDLIKLKSYRRLTSKSYIVIEKINNK